MNNDSPKTRLQAAYKTFSFGWYEHYKGTRYCAFALSIDENTLELLVHYSDRDGIIWTRTLENFQSDIDAGVGTMKRFLFKETAVVIEVLSMLLERRG